MTRGKEELVDLCSQLRGEKLIVSSEIDQLRHLNGDIARCLNELLQTAWISCKQQLTVSKLVHSGVNSTPRNSCRQVKSLENTLFIDSCKRLGRYDCYIRQLVQILLSDSSLLANLLNFFDSMISSDGSHSTNPFFDPADFCQSLFSGLYGCCIFGSDEKLVAETLLHLMRLQLVPSVDPRRLLRRGSCSFSRLYKLFNESMFAAKVFLTCALHEPIMDVLSMDDAFLDIDPNKILNRFSPQERLDKFGDEGSAKFKDNLSKYRKTVINKLFALSQKFIISLKSSLHCFPPVISILVRRLNDMLLTRQGCDHSDDQYQIQASLISIDLIFTYFICPAIAKPESLAIVTDTPISSVARHNLMQIGQVLQSLAVSAHEKLDSKCSDLFNQFEPDCVSSIVQAILSSTGSNDISLGEMYASGETNCNFNSGRPSITRQIALLTITDLDSLVALLRKYVSSSLCERVACWKEISDLMNKFPERFMLVNSADDVNRQNQCDTSPSSTIRKTIKLPRPAGRGLYLPRSPSSDKPIVGSQGEGTLKGSHSNLSISGINLQEDGTVAPIEVLVIRLSDNITPLQLEFLSEESFLNSIRSTGSVKNEGAIQSDRSIEKRTRFDLESLGTGNSDQLNASSDEESVSSSLDALGTQDQALNDNFSDVDALPISADVSGRGSPNISGRDTPLSVHTEQPDEGVTNENDEVGAGEAEGDGAQNSRRDDRGNQPQQVRQLPPLPNVPRKENRADIEEKFFKFEIPQPARRERHRDETHSLVSDSWSTDVLASDSEFGVDAQALQQQHGVVLPDIVPGQPPDIPRLDLIAEEVVVPVTHATGLVFPTVASVASSMPAGSGRTLHAFLETYSGPCDRSDTWSVDATASDSDADALRSDDRMREFDEVSVPSNPVTYGSTTVVADVTAVTSLKIDERRHSMAGFPGLAVCSTAELPDGGRATPIASVVPKLDVRRSESLVPSAGIGLSLANVQSTSSIASQFRGGAGGSNWSEMSTVGSFSQQSVTFSDDSSDAASNAHGASSGANGVDHLLNDSLDEKSPSAVANISTHFGDQSMFKDDQSPNKFDTVDNSSAPDINSAESNSARRRKSDLDKMTSVMHDGGSKRSSKKTSYTFTSSRQPFVANNSRTFDHIFEKDDKKRNFLKTFKLSNLKSKVKRSTTDQAISLIGINSAAYEDANNGVDGFSSTVPRATSMELGSSSQFLSSETSDQILAKYRRRQQRQSQSESVGEELTTRIDSVSISESRNNNLNPETNQGDSKPYYDASNVTGCQAFVDVKRKLRLVLSSINVGTLSIGLNVLPSYNLSNLKSTKETELVQFLNVLLAEALNTSDKILSSQLREVLRCLSLFDAKGVRKLVRALHEEHRHRSAYVTFLQQSRLNLLQALSYLEKLITRIFREQTLNREWLIEFCARLYLDQNCEKQLRNFVEDFRSMQLQDERTEFVEKFLSTLFNKMMRDEMWQGAPEDQLKHARLSVERYVMALIYAYAFYPNGEADMFRDEVFYEAIKRLSAIISPSYKDLQIPQELHAECPWPLAQAEIAIINAYKTPRDRLGCVLRCCETIVNLLRVSRMGKTPSADDIVPVLVFVLIKANPAALLSTVQYINGFYGKRLHGEEAYWWTQFCSAVEFIKVMVNTKD